MKDEKVVCELLDKLYLDAFDLIEQEVRCKVQIEKLTYDGQLHMAKARYIQGSKTVSVNQLPTENSADFNALCTVSETDSGRINQTLELEIHQTDKESGHIDPMKWFGVLVPQSLQFAKSKYRSAIELSVECANIQLSLFKTFAYISELLNLKIKN